ncbi:hypothetical protein LCGC14_0408730 [marine sediment metagenome]|uniref:Uncharacterized protein n=1 Tax=marine sediment metagenome TaxID=412755 RepID=A0A0F9VGI8_9ZZZZ
MKVYSKQNANRLATRIVITEHELQELTAGKVVYCQDYSSGSLSLVVLNLKMPSGSSNFTKGGSISG